jgi:hypothetical protein
MGAPWTRDATVRAYVAVMAPEVAGRIVELPVADNEYVSWVQGGLKTQSAVGWPRATQSAPFSAPSLGRRSCGAGSGLLSPGLLGLSK